MFLEGGGIERFLFCFVFLMVLPLKRKAFLQADRPDWRGVCEERSNPVLWDCVSVSFS